MVYICEKKIQQSAAYSCRTNIFTYKFYRFKKKQYTELKTKQFKEDILNQWESMGFPKLISHVTISKMLTAVVLV